MRVNYVSLCCLPLRGRRGDVCERRLRREKRAKRSGRIKAIGKQAVPAQTEALIQQNMSTPYRRLCVNDNAGETFYEKTVDKRGTEDYNVSHKYEKYEI